MAKNVVQVRLTEIMDHREQYDDAYQGRSRKAWILFAKGIEAGEDKEKNIAIMVYSERIANDLRVGETYSGYFIPKITIKGHQYFPLKLTASDNVSLQKEGFGYGGKPSGGGAAPSGGAAPARQAGGQYTLDELAALQRECLDTVRGYEGEASPELEAALVRELFDAAVLQGIKVGANTGGATPSAGSVCANEVAGLQPAILAAIEAGQMTAEYEMSNVTIEEAVEMWKRAGGNATQFCIALNGRLAQGGAAQGGGTDDGMPF